MKNPILFLVLLLPSCLLLGQESYNNCNAAFELCPNTTFTLNNIDANATVCSNCEDDFNFCFSGENTIWMTFTTNDLGGGINVDFSNLNFENNPGQGNAMQAAIIEATVPCVSSSYSLISNCEANATTNFSLTAANLTANTTYYVIVNGAMGASQNAEATFDVAINGTSVDRNPQLSISTDTTVICKNNNITFYASTQDCEDQQAFNWFANGNLIGTTVDPSFEYKDISDGDVITAELICFLECQDTITSNALTFTVVDFLVNAGPNLEIQQGESIKLEGQTDGLNVVWSPPYNINDPTLIQPIVTPNETTTYYLTVDNGFCSITDEMTVFVEDELEIPNTFSPNGDGINDKWEILGISNFPDCNIQVFTRWGQLVFQTTGYSEDKRWDGTSKSGKELAPGTYYYVINLRDDSYEEPLKGTVSIIK